MPGSDSSAAVCRDLQSPIRRGCSRFPGLNNGDSPGDGETSQDIFWDSTSPTQGHPGSGVRNIRVVEISDIVNRIAPKDVKPEAESALLRWIGDSAFPSTPEVPEAPVPRTRKRSSRQSSVEDLLKLARQFDRNMQEDKQTSEQLLRERVNTSKVQTRGTPSDGGGEKDPKDQVEAELHALFDCSTQKVSGPLSEASAASACSQDVKDRPGTPPSAEPRPAREPESGPAARPAEEKGRCGFSGNKFDDFDDDDWENDDLLNDSLVLALTQDPDQHQNTDQHQNPKPDATFQSNTGHPSSIRGSSPGGRRLQDLCPKPKTTHRSTFKLESNPRFGAEPAPASSCSFTVAPPQKPEKVPDRAAPAADSTADASDSLWGDGADDALLYQVCDRVERISNSQPREATPGSRRDNQRKTTRPLPIDGTWAAGGGGRQSPGAFVRSNSLPGTTVSYRGWSAPPEGANTTSRMSQSLPGSRGSLGAFGRCRDPSGAPGAAGGGADVDETPRTVTARSCHTAFKRNVSDSAAICSKVFVTSQTAGKCSAAEIERKKQEALARRRQRLQNAPPKP